MVAVENILKMDDYEKQYKMLNMIFEKLFKVENVVISDLFKCRKTFNCSRIALNLCTFQTIAIGCSLLAAWN